MTIFTVHKKGSNAHVASAIDSGGMDVFYTPFEDADHFKTRKEALRFLARVVERYPDEAKLLEVFQRDSA